MLLQRKKIFLSISGCLLALMLLFAVLHLEKISIWVDYAMFILRPVLIGLAIAYICNPIFRAFERKLFFGVRPHKLRRVLSLIVTYLILVLVLAALIMLIVPQLIGSILDFQGIVSHIWFRDESNDLTMLYYMNVVMTATPHLLRQRNPSFIF